MPQYDSDVDEEEEEGEEEANDGCKPCFSMYITGLVNVKCV
jgi:hypothetical protein